MSSKLMKKLELAWARKRQAKAPSVGPSAPVDDYAQASIIESTPTAMGDGNPLPIIGPVVAPSKAW